MDKEYHRQKAKEHYQKYKKQYNERNQRQKRESREYMNSLKTQCIMCPESEPIALDFHHIGDKDMEVSQMTGMSKHRIDEEITKCVVLCANCHRKVHGGILTIPEGAQGVREHC